MPETWFEVEMIFTVGWGMYKHFIQFELVKKKAL
jgi:hypothetical protein